MKPARSCCSRIGRSEAGGTLFDVDNTLATALIDRLMHHGEAIVIQGACYRMKDKDTNPPSA
jgi:DNA replication protein DnaC